MVWLESKLVLMCRFFFFECLYIISDVPILNAVRKC